MRWQRQLWAGLGVVLFAWPAAAEPIDGDALRILLNELEAKYKEIDSAIITRQATKTPEPLLPGNGGQPSL